MKDTTESGARAEVGDRLRVVARALGGAQAAADVAGVSLPTFRRWIRGHTDVTLGAITRLSSATGFTREWIAFGTGPAMPAAATVGALDRKLVELERRWEEVGDDLLALLADIDELKRRTAVVAPPEGSAS